MYPDNCVQSIIHPEAWWIKNEQRELCRGALLYAFLPHIDQVPYTVEPVGRADPEKHDVANVHVAPLRINQPKRRADLPVAAMTLHEGELWTAYRAKKRPCLAIGSLCPAVDGKLVLGMAKHSTAATVLAAPYYGADQDGKRAGYKPAFVERIRHCEYPQFFWDQLPIRGPKESILRLDHIQPIGTHHNSYELSEFKLSDSALRLIDDLILWVVFGGIPEESEIVAYRQLIEEFFP